MECCGETMEYRYSMKGGYLRKEHWVCKKCGFVHRRNGIEYFRNKGLFSNIRDAILKAKP